MLIGKLIKLLSITSTVAVLTIVTSACASSPASAPLAAPTAGSGLADSTTFPAPPLPPLPPGAIANTQPVAEPAMATGQELFVAKGCSACHGQNGEGTDFAPALPGHSPAQVKRQARAPIGLMPIFPPDKISNEELEAIAEFIGGLSGGHAHVMVPGSGNELTLHHWMALFAIEAGDDSEAIHHVRHLMDLTEGQHRARMQDTLLFIEAGETHEAAHVVESMLAGIDQTGIDEATMHLTLGLSSARVDEAEIAAHHIEHFLEVATGDEHEMGEEIFDLLVAEDFLEAEHRLEQLLGGEMVSESEDGHGEAHDDDEAHDDTEAHDEAEAHDDEEAHDSTEAHDDAEDAHDEGEGHDDAEAHDDTEAHDESEAHDDEEAHDEEEGHGDDGHSN